MEIGKWLQVSSGNQKHGKLISENLNGFNLTLCDLDQSFKSTNEGSCVTFTYVPNNITLRLKQKFTEESIPIHHRWHAYISMNQLKHRFSLFPKTSNMSDHKTNTFCAVPTSERTAKALKTHESAPVKHVRLWRRLARDWRHRANRAYL